MTIELDSGANSGAASLFCCNNNNQCVGEHCVASFGRDIEKTVH